MSVKDVLLRVLPARAEGWLRDAVYRRNCALPPARYRAELRRWYRLMTGHDCDLDDPQTLGEKIQWLKLYDSTPEKGRLADKYLVRRWVADRVGERYLVPLLGVWDHAEDVDFDALPARFVLKATHGSGWNVIVCDRGALDVGATRERLARWLATRKAMTGGFELHYEFCEPRVIAERYLADSSGGLRDYKFVTLGGEVQFVLAIEGRYADEVSGSYLPDWSRAPFTYGYRVGRDGDIPRPARLGEMLELARALGEGFAFARVDLYEAEGRVYFGEITFTEANGLSVFSPARYDLEYGRRLTLPEAKPFRGVML